MIFSNQKIRFSLFTIVAIMVLITFYAYNDYLDNYEQSLILKLNSIEKDFNFKSKQTLEMDSLLKEYDTNIKSLYLYGDAEFSLNKRIYDLGNKYKIVVQDIITDRRDYFLKYKEYININEIPVERQTSQIKLLGDFISIGSFMDDLSYLYNDIEIKDYRLELSEIKDREIFAYINIYNYKLKD